MLGSVAFGEISRAIADGAKIDWRARNIAPANSRALLVWRARLRVAGNAGLLFLRAVDQRSDHIQSHCGILIYSTVSGQL